MVSKPYGIETFSADCPACHGTGLYTKAKGYNDDSQVPGQECEKCWGTGISNTELSHSVCIDLAHRNAVVDNYSK